MAGFTREHAMSSDEMMVLVFCGVLALALAAAWLYSAFGPSPLHGSKGARWPMWLMPPVCFGVVLVALQTLAADDVRNAPQYIALYAVLGACWVGITMRFAPLFGLYPRQDIVERRNPAAGWVMAGLMLGITFAYSGGNVGNGPGWWVVLACAALSTVTLYAVWCLVDWMTGITEFVTINRDRAAGIRLAAFLAASGLILGWAVAGDWVSVTATVRDLLHRGWLVFVLVVFEAMISAAAHPSADDPAPKPVLRGAVPAALYLIFAVLIVAPPENVR
jgi:hypothetical protein